jgi:TPP-dependent pyruvate/acetoin dehydrogenase alpha subunit
MNYKLIRENSLYYASLSRYFENEIFKLIQKKKISFPVYFSAGQEYIASTIAAIFKFKKIKPMLFGQHRGHSIYVAFGGDLKKLALEFFGSKNGCTYGMGGSLSLHSKKITMYGHDGFMGSNVCIGVGMSFVTKKPSIIFIGDAAFEEDYVLATISWMAKKNIPCLIVVEDNNFAITTSKKERRDWKVKDIAKAFKIEAYEFKDDPVLIYKNLKNYSFNKPRILNIHTNRLYWHTGAGIDDNKIFDRLKYEIKKNGKIGNMLNIKALNKIKNIFKKINNEK